jgi:ABC-2 type transport system ATP-binding protein
MDAHNAIEAEGLEKVYRSRFRGRQIRAVSDLTLRVPEGVKYGLLGANGAGKTTFVKMVLAAVHPPAGRAALFGRDAGEPEARRPVGYLPENHRFPTYFTGAGMLDFYAALSGMPGLDRGRRIRELLAIVGLSDWGDVRIKKYSKGMLQRLGLAQALMHRPRLLVLDEPTDGVDPLGRRQIRDTLNSLLDTGVTIFINSHLLTEVEAFCDRVAIIHKGRLALEGRIHDLVAGRGYKLTAVQAAEEVRRAVSAITGAVTLKNDRLEAQISNREELNRAIDILRQSGALIDSVIATASTLEDVFIRTTQGETQLTPPQATEALA